MYLFIVIWKLSKSNAFRKENQNVAIKKILKYRIK